MDRPGGYEPSNARSTRAGDAVAVADLAMQRTVTPPYVGSVSAPLRSAQNRGPLDLVRPTSHLERDMERNPAMESTFAGF